VKSLIFERIYPSGLPKSFFVRRLVFANLSAAR